ncbi:hypothetical protein PPL_10802 [Heterostelium album PN500]|uniref:Uncharacterized protein n=1 Tax=Heterostelium pallidum (strain ATCC 26659 / Pp 5 / PN500) TaxID=670386 RepID=D3BS11_HETP5|nr:hypothetical protein PPL_10802 [Heterostelium album PN500]EFA75748.1 hypothetical protein PPL_10802 [Heterostelium album PN500]|eukprot:XP_020427882.1 hypothetical protein PPL_10802 [Heterostelium album PN500]
MYLSMILRLNQVCASILKIILNHHLLIHQLSIFMLNLITTIYIKNNNFNILNVVTENTTAPITNNNDILFPSTLPLPTIINSPAQSFETSTTLLPPPVLPTPFFIAECNISPQEIEIGLKSISSQPKFLSPNPDFCKRWFDNRNRYLLFDTNTLYCTDKHSSRITLNSYRSIISESLNQKRECRMLVSSEYSYVGLYDHKIDYDSIKGIDEIDQNIEKVTMSSEMFKREYSDKLFTRLYDLISKSNVNSLLECHTLKYGIPMNITSLVFHSTFNEPLFKGCFPPNLKKLKFIGDIKYYQHGYFNQVIEVGVLPDTLEKFVIYNLNQILEPGVLPTSLKIFKIIRSAPDNYLKVGSLPPNLEEFCHNYDRRDDIIDSNILPNSLITLESVPVSWMNSIKQLENLRSLMLVGNSGCLDLSDLPQSLTRLDISSSVKLQSALPTSIRHLNLGNSKYDIDELFPDRTQYHFESLELPGFKQESLDGLDIKRLALYNFPYFERSEKVRVIPFGVETLDVSRLCIKFKFNQNSLPSSLNTLDVYRMNIFKRPGIIPNSVNHLIIREKDANIHIAEGVLPDSVQNIIMLEVAFPTSKMVDNISFEEYDSSAISFKEVLCFSLELTVIIKRENNKRLL